MATFKNRPLISRIIPIGYRATDFFQQVDITAYIDIYKLLLMVPIKAILTLWQKNGKLQSNHVPKNIVWFRISKHYISRCSNIPVRIYHSDVESMMRPQDPLTARKTNAEGALLLYAEALDWINFRRLLRSPERCLSLPIQYNRFKMYLPMRKRRFKPKRVGACLLSYLMWPLGVVLYLIDQMHLTTHLKNLLQTLSRF